MTKAQDINNKMKELRYEYSHLGAELHIIQEECKHENKTSERERSEYNGNTWRNECPDCTRVWHTR